MKSTGKQLKRTPDQRLALALERYTRAEERLQAIHDAILRNWEVCLQARADLRDAHMQILAYLRGERQGQP